MNTGALHGVGHASVVSFERGGQLEQDSPRTRPADWEGALLKRGGVQIGRVGEAKKAR